MREERNQPLKNSDWNNHTNKIRKKKRSNLEYKLVSVFFVLIFLSQIAYLIYFDGYKSQDFINSSYNTRQDTFADRVVRGKIRSSDGETLAYTNVDEDGYEERVYPYGNMFAHAVGFDTHGKSGLEAQANFSLLTSNAFFLNQLKNEFRGEKNPGDTIVATLDYQVQKAAYDALGDRYGAVVAIEPSTGKILAMVSKPDFDPNSMAWDYDSYANSNGSNLLNRATNGKYPPGSTFKIVTALDYFRQRGTVENYNFNCEGTVTQQQHTIRCYGGNVHGFITLEQAFAKSCNTAFATMGVDLGAKSLIDTAESVLFNKKLPYPSTSQSAFTLKKEDDVPIIMQTSIGQGNTLVSPMHMAMLTSAIANSGVLMEPYMIDSIENNEGTIIKKMKPDVYRRIMTNQEAAILGRLMRAVVENGTASALNDKPYTVAGKTGSAEYNAAGDSHSWFVGYCNVDHPDLVVAVLVEGGGTGSAAAVPIAGKVFDAYYTSHAAEVAETEDFDFTDYENGSESSGEGWFEIFEEYEEVFTDFDDTTQNSGSETYQPDTESEPAFPDNQDSWDQENDWEYIWDEDTQAQDETEAYHLEEDYSEDENT